MSGKVLFYHLTRDPIERGVRLLIERCQAKGWRVAVRGPSRDRLAWLDHRLWVEGPEDGFLPHGLEGGSHDAEQPVLLTEGEPVNGATALLVFEGAKLSAQECERYERTCILFHHADEHAMTLARSDWQKFVKAGVQTEYWSQADGGWKQMR